MSRSLLPSSLVPLVSNSYWREPDAERILAVWAQSGLTLSAFARQCGLNVRRLARWRKRLEGVDGPRFHPVEIVSESSERSPGADSGVALIVDCGQRISVQRDFDPETLKQLLEVLEHRRC